MAAELFASPGINGRSTAPTPAPEVLDGRFSFGEGFIIDGGEGFYLPFDAYANPLSPMETGTDVVLPVVAQLKGRPDKHHAYFYEVHYKAGGTAARALRFSRLQRLGRKAHAIYHQNYLGTPMPEDDAAAARAVILNSAGYVPHMGVKVEDDGVSIEEITPAERAALSKPKVFYVERSMAHQAEIGKFLMEHALTQEFDTDKLSEVEEFLALTPRKMAYDRNLRARKLDLGLQLTDIALERAVDPVAEDYREAYNRGALRRYTPASAWEWAKKLIKNHEDDYLETLEDQLLERYGIVA